MRLSKGVQSLGIKENQIKAISWSQPSSGGMCWKMTLKQEVQALGQKTPNTPTTKSTLVFHDLLDILSDKNQMHALIFFILTSLNGNEDWTRFQNQLRQAPPSLRAKKNWSKSAWLVSLFPNNDHDWSVDPKMRKARRINNLKQPQEKCKESSSQT